MARKPTDKQLFKMKNEWLGQFYEEVKPTKGHREIPIGHREIPIGQRGLKSRKISAIFFSEKGKKTLLIRLAVKRSKGQYIIYISK